MVATATAAVSGGQSKLSRVVFWHLAGLAIGAGLLGLIISMIGASVSIPAFASAVLLGTIALLWGGATLLGRPLPVVSTSAQVPLAWRYTLGPGQYAFGYGVGLGLGVLTRVSSLSLYAFFGVLLLLGDPLAGLMLSQVYAVARAVPLLFAADTGRSAVDVGLTERWRWRIKRLDAAALVAGGSVLLASAA
jgi:cytochrome c biogenesis protein CcdA